MLTYESLIEQAKVRGMPSGKMRGVLREYLQILILKEMSKHKSGHKLFFTGETYLRLAHNTGRFSEDLDFNARGLSKNEFEGLVRHCQTELRRFNLDSEVSFKHWGKMLVGFMTFTDVEKTYNVISKHSKKEGLKIKIETNSPDWKIKDETLIISGFGEMYPLLCTDIGALFADKIDALTKKNRARHLYDIIFMLSNKILVDMKVLKSLGIKKNPMDAIKDRVESFSIEELKKQADELRPFLFDESQSGLILNAKSIVPQLIKQYA